MKELADIPNTEWEITIREFIDQSKRGYIVTRRFPKYSIAQTKIFRTRWRARKQFDKWLQNSADFRIQKSD